MERIFAKNWFGVIARVVLTFMFWASGLAKSIDFSAGMAEMTHFGLEPAAFFNVATIVVQLGGSALIILNFHAWAGALALAVFTAATIPIAHTFWTMEEPIRTIEFYVVVEHISIIGALLVVAWATSRKDRSTPAPAQAGI
ncbi:MAG: DoxX family protein [Pseudochelatococcus sp.]|jgi:transmembrane protein|uniref:DoxX family protein n=1 Tax=Pseudochelatococcus sp. TaxID=2020869 RepID=UPI003D93B143